MTGDAEEIWLCAKLIKLVVWAPSHSIGTERDASLVGRTVMALGRDKGWLPGRIVEPPSEKRPVLSEVFDSLSTDKSKYYVVFNQPHYQPGDPLSMDASDHAALFPYEFCLILDEKLTPTSGTSPKPERSTPNHVGMDVLGWETFDIPEEMQKGRRGRVTELFDDSNDAVVEFVEDGKTARLDRNDYYAVKSVPEISKENEFDFSLVTVPIWTFTKEEIDGENEWLKGYIIGFRGPKYRILLNGNRRIRHVKPADVLMQMILENNEAEAEQTDATDQTDAADQTEAGAAIVTMEIDSNSN